MKATTSAKVCGFLIAIQSIFISCTLQAQIIIKEKVSINPRGKILLQYAPPVTSSGTLKYKAQYSGSLKTGNYIIVNHSCSGGHTDDFFGTNEVTSPAVSGIWGTAIGLYPNGPGTLIETWNIDDVTFETDTIPLNCNNCTFWNPRTFGLFPDFYFQVGQSSIDHSTRNGMSQGGIDGDACQSPAWYPRFGSVFAITRGVQYGQFVTSGGERLGASINCNAYELGGISYIADGEQPTSVFDTVEITASCAGTAKKASFIVRNTELFVDARVEENEIVYHNERSLLIGELVDILGADGSYLAQYYGGDSLRLVFKIVEGGKFGTLVGYYSGVEGSTITLVPDWGLLSVVEFWANGENPDTVEQVRVAVSSNNPSFGQDTVTIFVIPSSCPVMQILPKHLAAGDTASIEIKLQGPGDELIAFPPDQLFGIWLYSDVTSGKLVSSSGEEGEWLFSVPQPFKFIAADSLEMDSVFVEIQAYVGGGISGSVASGTKSSVPTKPGVMLKTQATNTITDAATVSEPKDKTEVLLERLKQRLNAMKENDPKRSRLSRIVANLEARPETMRTVPQKAVDAKVATTASIAQDYDNCPPMIDTVMVKGVEPELVVYGPDEKDQFIKGTNLPKMPKPLVKAQLKNYSGGQIEFHWKLTIKWKAKAIDFTTPKDKTEKYEGEAFGQNSDTVDLEIGEYLYGEENMRGGDSVFLTITCTTKVDGKVFSTSPTVIINPFIIKGQNPTLATVLLELSEDKYAAVAAHESNFNQFHIRGSKSLKGESYNHPQIVEFPFQGDDPTDFGMMQINRPWIYPTWEYNGSDEYNDYRCDDIIWNWVTNVQQGKLMLNKRFDVAKTFHNRYDAIPLTDDQRYRQGYCEYNKGPGKYYWSWVPPITVFDVTLKEGHWERNDKGADKVLIAGREYADKVFGLYEKHPWR